jgi:hypothetical protein
MALTAKAWLGETKTCVRAWSNVDDYPRCIVFSGIGTFARNNARNSYYTK